MTRSRRSHCLARTARWPSPSSSALSAHWLEFFIDGLATQLGEVKAEGERIIRRDVIAREHSLNARQALAIGMLLEQAELRVDDLESLCPGVNRRTLQRDLQSLVERGLLKSFGAARLVKYRLKIKGL